jgi:tetratricopeptide (TPR) repeat protein
LLGGLLYGLGGWGYGGWGYGGYGLASGWGYPSYGYAYDPYAYSGTYYAASAPVTTYVPETVVASTQPPVPAQSEPTAAAPTTSFADQGEAAFRSGDYKQAAYAWRHAIVDNPQNPTLIMMLAQSMFATGNFNEAAGATQAAMQMLPKEQWGVVIGNYKELYRTPQDYTDQLRALEKAVKDKPNDPALRFLLGYHYAYLGYPQQSIDQLDAALKAEPRDEAAKKLRDEMRAKLPKSAIPETPAVPVPPPPAAVP